MQTVQTNPTPVEAAVAEICYGPMKSGKSRYLVQLAERFRREGVSFLAFKPVFDTRDGSFIRSRDTACRDVQALALASSQEVLERVNWAQAEPQAFVAALPADQGAAPGSGPGQVLSLRDAFVPGQALQAVLIDEVFLLDGGLLAVLDQLLAAGISVHLSGLDRDFRGEYFPLRHFERYGVTMAEVIGRCVQAEALHASCEVCEAPAELTQRLINGQPAPYDSPTVLIGDEEYEPRCREHHLVLGKPVRPSLFAAS